MSALIVVDCQHDFISGSLAVEDAPAVLPVIYDLLDNHTWDVVVATQDYHPPGHISFASTHGRPPFTSIRIAHPITSGLTGNPAEMRVSADDAESGETIEQNIWPDHTIQGTKGCEIDEGVQARIDKLGIGERAFILRKGAHPLIDSYSVFGMNHYVQFTELPRILFARGITKVTIVGLAMDWCVKASAIDARKFLLDVDVVRAGTRAVDPRAADATLAELARWGCRII